MSQHCRANPCCGDRPCSGIPLPQHASGLPSHNKSAEAPALSTTLQEPFAYLNTKDGSIITPKHYGDIISSKDHYTALYTSPPTLAHQPVTAGWVMVPLLLAALKSEGRNDKPLQDEHDDRDGYYTSHGLREEDLP